MFKFPWSNFHELNLDWILEKIKHLEETVAAITGSATPSSAPPLMDGAAEPGTSENYSRGDHRHPTDTSRAAQVDLAAEVLNRNAADGALEDAIGAVDAKIQFSSSAPDMDSSSASAGFSDFQARADHVHPTDTSRASQSDFDTLKARVDGITGSASPYDGMPLMDGVASAGDVGAYSRGNHRHPSDTSKVDKSGDTITGDLTIEGRLTLTEQEQHVNTNAVGWLRVATVPQTPGTRCRFHIVRKGTVAPAEIHRVALSILQGSVVITEEDSQGDVCYINSVRYTNAGAVDIHVDQTAESVVGIYMNAYAPSAADVDAIKLITPAGVADAPVGETVLSIATLSLHGGPKIISGTAYVTNGFITITDDAIRTDSNLLFNFKYYSGMPSLTWFAVLEPQTGYANVYIRNPDASRPADNTRVDYFAYIA